MVTSEHGVQPYRQVSVGATMDEVKDSYS